MRPELKRLIVNARVRLGEYTMSADEAEQNARQQVMNDFEHLFTSKISMATIFELHRNSEKVWVEDRPAIQFHVDGHTLVLVGGEGEWKLLDQTSGQSLPLLSLSVSDPQFEDRLLTAVGNVVDPLKQ